MIQIFGRKSCNESKKAERFLKERKIKYQMIDLDSKGLSKGELNAILKVYSLEDLIDVNSREYQSKNLKYMVYDPEELVLTNGKVIKSPIIRMKSKIFMGYDENVLKGLIES